MKREKDKTAKEKLGHLDRELAELKETSNGLKAHWKREKDLIENTKRMKAELDALKVEEQSAERRGDLEKVAEIRYGRVIDIKKKLEETGNRLSEIQERNKMLKEEVDEEDVAQVVSKWTGIPVARMLQGEMEKLIKMEENLAYRVKGQDHALAAVANTIRRARAGIQDASRPVGSFIFLGPTGVGKTELVRTLAMFLFDDEKAMVRLDMSEYMEKHAVSRLIGAPPGYVGYEEGGQLTEAIKRRPYSIVLLDEIEKAHPDVFNILLQILDDGRLTDGKGRTIDFKNTIVIMTSNLGSQMIKSLSGDFAMMTAKVREILEGHFRPEFLNRVDEIVIFKALSRAVIFEILDLQIDDLKRRLSERKLNIEIDPAAKEILVERGYDPVYGARPLKRILQQDIQNELALKILNGEYHEGDTVVVDLDKENKYVFTRKDPGSVN